MPAHARAVVDLVTSEDRWPRIRAVIAEVAGATTFDRARRFAAAWADDGALREEIADFLATSGQEDELLYLFPTEWLCAVATVDAVDRPRPVSPLGPRPAARTWQPGTVVGPYLVEQLVGEGGMGQVFAAHDQRLGRAVALKRVSPAKADRPDASARSLIEASAVARLDHPNIATVYDVLEHDGRLVIVMQYVEGRSLKRHLTRGPFDVTRALRVAHAIAGAADYAHQQGIVHCDIKPGNIHLTSTDVPKLLDFGIARLLGGGRSPHPGTPLASAVGGRFGTPGYMAPEQLTGRPVDPRTDVYAIGVVLYEMLSGDRPYGRSDPMVASLMLLEGEAPDLTLLNPSVPATVRALVAKAMAADPAARFSSAAALQQELGAVLEGAGVSARRLSRPAGRLVRFSHAALAGVVVPLVLWLGVEANTVTLRAYTPAAHAHYERGVRALQEGAYLDATRALEQAVSLEPDCALGWARLAEGRAELDDSEGAREALAKVATLVPDRSRLDANRRLELEAVIGMASRDYPSVLAAYTGLAARQHQPSAVRAIELGRAHEASDHLLKAIEAYREALALDPNAAVALLRLGVLYARRDDVSQRDRGQAEKAFAAALALYERAGRLEGQALVYYERGAMYERLQQAATAHQALTRALALAREADNPYLRTASLFKLSSVAGQRGRYDEAQRLGEEAVESGEGFNGLVAEGLVDYGTVYLRQDNQAEAARQYERALKLAQRARARRAEARAQLAAGNLDIHQGRMQIGLKKVEAATRFYTAGGYRRLLIQARTTLAQRLNGLGEYGQAERQLEALLRLAQTQQDVAEQALQHDGLCTVLESAERYSAALAHCDTAVAMYRQLGLPYDVAYAMLRRGDLLWRVGRPGEATRQLESLLGRDSPAGPPTAEVRRMAQLRLADAALSLDQWARARVFAEAGLSTEANVRADMQAQLRVTMALALARMGQAARALSYVDAALDAVRVIGEPVFLARFSWVRSEVLLEQGQPADALTVAIEVAEDMGRRGLFESAWWAHMTAARAATALGRTEVARERRARADDAWARFATLLTPADFEAFARRPDVQRIRRLNVE